MTRFLGETKSVTPEAAQNYAVHVACKQLFAATKDNKRAILTEIGNMFKPWETTQHPQVMTTQAFVDFFLHQLGKDAFEGGRLEDSACFELLDLDNHNPGGPFNPTRAPVLDKLGFKKLHARINMAQRKESLSLLPPDQAEELLFLTELWQQWDREAIERYGTSFLSEEIQAQNMRELGIPNVRPPINAIGNFIRITTSSHVSLACLISKPEKEQQEQQTLAKKLNWGNVLQLGSEPTADKTAFQIEFPLFYIKENPESGNRVIYVIIPAKLFLDGVVVDTHIAVEAIRIEQSQKTNRRIPFTGVSLPISFKLSYAQLEDNGNVFVVGEDESLPASEINVVSV